MTNPNCAGCLENTDLIWVWGSNGRSFKVCKSCYKTNKVYSNLELVKGGE